MSEKKTVEATGPTKDVEVRKSNYEHRFKLTDADIFVKGKLAAADRAAMVEYEMKAQAAKSFWKSKIDETKSSLALHLSTICMGTELRTVEATLEYDYLQKQVRYVFENEVLAHRVMTPAETQRTLALAKA